MDCNKRVCHISEDRISELPEEILVSILSRLLLKEAAKTSVLSSRWRYLWTYVNGKVHFYEDDWDSINWNKFVDRINGILKLLRSPRIEAFEVVFEEAYSVEHIYPWIEFVAKKDVKIFQLALGDDCIGVLPGTLSAMPYLSFGSLELLLLDHVDVGNETVQYILSNSPNLEIIEFYRLLSLSSLSITSSSLTKLKKLVLIECDKLKNVYISSRSLEDLIIRGHFRGRLDIDAKSVPRLHTLGIGNSRLKSPLQLMYRLFRDKFLLGQLQTLHLDIQGMVEYGVTAVIRHVNLPILKHLQLCINPAMLNCINSLLTAAPVLHTLEIRLAWRCEESLKEEILYDKIVPPSLPIKMLKLTQFLGNKTDVMILKNFIKSSESLQKLIIIPYSPKCRDVIYRFPYRAAASRANERIKDLCEEGILSKKYLPSRIELVIESDFYK